MLVEKAGFHSLGQSCTHCYNIQLYFPTSKQTDIGCWTASHLQYQIHVHNILDCFIINAFMPSFPPLSPQLLNWICEPSKQLEGASPERVKHNCSKNSMEYSTAIRSLQAFWDQQLLRLFINLLCNKVTKPTANKVWAYKSLCRNLKIWKCSN